MSDRDGRKVAVFALNFGLCQKYAIRFGRPQGEREFRTYFVERIFDFTPIFQRYMEKNQEIVCEMCGTKYSLEHLDALKFYNMRCKVCGSGTCIVINLSRKYEPLLKGIDQQLLLPATELGILQTLESENEPLFAAQIAAELDCSYQLVGKRGKFLDERGLVTRARNEQGRRTFGITTTAKESYFSKSESDDLEIE